MLHCLVLTVWNCTYNYQHLMKYTHMCIVYEVHLNLRKRTKHFNSKIERKKQSLQMKTIMFPCIFSSHFGAAWNNLISYTKISISLPFLF